ncbi:glucose-6-phosphate dehydrogenase (NADP(+)) [Candidatus Saccharibacteria bacterium]|nr:glucose-6-phosphate dehydrogenase (NADP(+)) [Candidatus Saccharibacteria bacterium]
MKTKLLIFGISGDLGVHKLLPALEQIVKTGDFDDLSIIGVSRRDVRVEDLLAGCSDCSILSGRISMYTMDLSDTNSYHGLKDHIGLADDEQLIVYLALPPQVVVQAIDNIGATGLNGSNVKVLFEKPFGTDLVSAEAVARTVSRYYDESQVYRIDHYLAKEMVQNIVTVREKNAMFSQIWKNGLISSISIMALETIGIEGRANFYEQTGALRDIVQGHLMQLLALTLMDVPSNLDWDNVPQLRLEALNKLKPADPSKVVRAQYEGYDNEVGNPETKTETFVALELESDHPSWQGIPIKLITGKGLSRKTTEIRIHIKKTDSDQSDCLVFRIQPDEGIGIELYVKEPGYGNKLELRSLDFNYQSDTRLPDAYERVIVDAISSRKSLFTSGEEVLQSWRVLQPVQDSWLGSAEQVNTYTVGTDLDTILA